MRTSQGFNYHQPSRDALAGIYVEVTDSAAETPVATFRAGQEESAVRAGVERLFGLTVSVDDQNTARQPMPRCGP